MTQRGHGLNDRFATSYGDCFCRVEPNSGTGTPTFEAYLDTYFISTFFQHNQDDGYSCTFQFDHDKLPQSNVEVHLHYSPMVAPAVSPEVVRLRYSYFWAKIGDTIPTLASWTTNTISLNVSTGDQFKHLYTTLVASIAPPAAETPSSMLFFNLTRLGASDAADTYSTGKATGTAAANFCAIYCDAHYQHDRIGSDTETAHL